MRRALPSLLALTTLVALHGVIQAQTLPDHSAFDRVLAGYVRGDLVDYAALAADRSDLDLYLERLARTSPSALDLASRAARLAFWINAYNACAMRLVIDHYPIEKRGGIAGIRNRVVGVPANSIRQIPHTWDAEFCRVAQEDRSLDGIEHGIIRPLGDPRIHFAVNCASRSCPVLAAEAYKTDRLEEQLDAAVERFIANPIHYRLEGETRPLLRLNKVLDWYEEDFGAEGVVVFLRRYVSPEDAALLREPGQVRLEYFDYDWTLNDVAVFGSGR